MSTFETANGSTLKSSGTAPIAASTLQAPIPTRSSYVPVDIGMGKTAAGGRGRALRVLFALGAVMLVTASTAGAVSKPPPPNSGQLFVPSSFELQGTNGYSIFVLGIPSRKGQPATVELFVQKKHAGVFYSAPATVTETSIQADLGELGEISVSFHRSGVAAIASPHCGRPVSFDSGSFEGKIDFRGEEGYTEAEATSAPGNIDFLLNGICGSFVTGGGSNPFSPGAELHLRNPALGAQFSVAKSPPDSLARFEVGDREYHDGISIQRFAVFVMPPAAFTYSPRLQTATVRPPAPFSGTAHFDRRKRANRRWSGDLAIDLPGRTDLPLTGHQLRAHLVRP